MRMLAWSAVVVGVGCGPTLPVRDVTTPDGPCVTLHGAVARLAPATPGSRHHPTAARLQDGTLLVAWQIGKADGRVAVRAFGPDLTPRAPEVVLSDGAHRATHPQVLGGHDSGFVAWQDDDTGAIHLVEVDALGAPLAPAQDVLPPDGPRPGLYPDLTRTADGVTAVWYAGPDPTAAWHVWHDGDLRLVEAGPGADKGGPATVAEGPDGAPWLAWGEQDVGWVRRETALVVGPVGGPRTTLAVDPARSERTALAFGRDGAGVVAWTRYPWRDQGWSSRALFFGPGDAAPAAPVAPGGGAATMIDVDATRDTAVMAWQQPVNGGVTGVKVQPWSLATGEPLCAPMLAHPAPDADQARANVVTWLGEGDRVEGVVVWHAALPRAGAQTVAGRAFHVDAGSGRQSR